MKRIFTLVVILVVAAAGASTADAFAQSRRVVRRADPPKDERAEKSEPQDEKKDDSKDAAKDGAKETARDEKRGDDEPLTGKEVAVRAVIKSKPNPGYPRGAREYGVRGAVKLRIVLGADGRVRDEMEVLEGLPYGVTEEAIKAARRIEFEPARKEDGRPVSQYVIVIYHFNLY